MDEGNEHNLALGVVEFLLGSKGPERSRKGHGQ